MMRLVFGTLYLCGALVGVVTSPFSSHSSPVMSATHRLASQRMELAALGVEGPSSLAVGWLKGAKDGGIYLLASSRGAEAERLRRTLPYSLSHDAVTEYLLATERE